MKTTIYSTNKIVILKPDPLADGVPARVWEGITESGIKIHCYITRVDVCDNETDVEEFEQELLPIYVPLVDLDDVTLLPKGFPTQTKDITGKQICLGDKVCYNFKGESNGYFIVVFENNAFRKSYPTWDQENEKPLLEYGRQAEEMKLKIV